MNALAPGPILTEQLERAGEQAQRMVAGRLPAGRLGQPAEVADAVTWLSSDQARFITGVTLPIDGGLLAGMPPYSRSDYQGIMIMNDPRTAELWLQYTHLDKLYGYLPGLAEAQPAIFGLDPDEHIKITERFAAAADGVAESLLDDAEFAAKIDALPFQPGQTVYAVGDSITDDSQSWLEILRGLLQRRKPGMTVINGGLSAHTTTMILRRWPASLASEAGLDPLPARRQRPHPGRAGSRSRPRSVWTSRWPTCPSCAGSRPPGPRPSGSG